MCCKLLCSVFIIALSSYKDNSFYCKDFYIPLLYLKLSSVS